MTKDAGGTNRSATIALNRESEDGCISQTEGTQDAKFENATESGSGPNGPGQAHASPQDSFDIVFTEPETQPPGSPPNACANWLNDWMKNFGSDKIDSSVYYGKIKEA